MAQFSLKQRFPIAIPLKPVWRFVLIFCVAICLALVIAQPLKRRAWRVIKQQGDKALINQQYELAKTEYAKLKLINPKSAEPEQLIAVVTEGERNIITLRQFYLEHGREDIVANIDKTTLEYPNEQQATLACQELFRDNHINLALLCITTITQKWPTYRDAWLTESLIAESAGDSLHAEEARAKAIQLDPAASE